MVIKLTINGRFLTQPITGVQRYAREFVTALDRLLDRGAIDAKTWQIRLLHPPDLQPPDLRLSQIEPAAVGRLAGHVWEQLELPQSIRGDVLLCLGNSAPIAHLWQFPTVVTVHDLSFRYFPAAYAKSYRLIYRLLTPLIMRSARAIITVSEAERQAILGYYPQAEQRLYAVQNGGLPATFNLAAEPDNFISPLVPISASPLNPPKLGDFRPVSSQSMSDLEHPIPGCDSPPFVLCVGALSRRKNLPGVLAAVAKINQRQPLNLVIIGSGSQALQQAGINLPPELLDRTRFTGQISDRQLWRYYRSALCLVFPSYYEASGLPPIEAMACGCPVIVSEIPALVERCGEAALYCQPDRVETIVEAIQQLIAQPELRQELRQKGLAQAAKFSWENCVLQTLAIIEKVVQP
jgi:glycosyltransferase involved in cell wall biosynthesis